jgi:mono/diheme cytochrome c family protein
VTGTAITFSLSSGTSDLILGLMAGVLVVFALVVSLVIPRRRPDFPSRRMGAFFAVTVLLVIGMLAAVEALGESHDFGAEHGGEAAEAPTTPADTQTSETGETETQATETETQETETGGGGAAEGDPAAGEQVFASAGCGSCHTLESAGSSGAVGPNLDQVLPGQDADYIRTQIVDPNSEITEGYQAGIMPENYGEQLSDEDLANLVAYLAAEAGS